MMAKLYEILTAQPGAGIEGMPEDEIVTWMSPGLAYNKEDFLFAVRGIGGGESRVLGEAGIDASDSGGAWTVAGSVVTGNDEEGVVASGALGSWTISDTQVAANSAAADEFDKYAGVDAGGSSGDWRITGSRITGHDGGGVRARSQGNWTIRDTVVADNRGGPGVLASGGNWTIRNARVVDNGAGSPPFSSSGVLAGGGNWTIKDTVIRSSALNGVSVSGSEGGDWRLDNVTITDNVFRGVYAPGTRGDWVIEDSVIARNPGRGGGVVARDSRGNWTIRNSRIVDNGDSFYRGGGVIASNSSGAWTITDSTLSGNVQLGVNATAAAITGDATYNYWGATDGPSGDFDGSGDAAIGNVDVRPYYTDPGRTTLGGLGPVCDSCAAPTDPDGDGLYEDVDGNGDVTFFDVLTLYDYFQNADSPTVEPFDFEDDGQLTFFDVLELFDEFRA